MQEYNEEGELSEVLPGRAAEKGEVNREQRRERTADQQTTEWRGQASFCKLRLGLLSLLHRRSLGLFVYVFLAGQLKKNIWHKLHFKIVTSSE